MATEPIDQTFSSTVNELMGIRQDANQPNRSKGKKHGTTVTHQESQKPVTTGRTELNIRLSLFLVKCNRVSMDDVMIMGIC